MRIVPLKRCHLDSIDMQDAQDYVARWVTPEIKAMLENTCAFAAVDGTKVLACSGLLEMWEGRALAWAMLAKDLGNQFVGVHRAVKTFLDNSHYNRIEATVDVGFDEGVRWIEMLGFNLETPEMKAYLPNGRAAAMYVRFKGG
jgi:hypothetical protein